MAKIAYVTHEMELGGVQKRTSLASINSAKRPKNYKLWKFRMKKKAYKFFSFSFIP